MGSQSIYTELRTRYITGWTPPTTEYPNEKFTKPSAAIWARFTIINGEQNQVDIGSDVKTFRSSGILIIQLFAPLDMGSVGVLAMADSVANVFRNWCGTTVTCRAASISAHGNDGFGWYQVNVSIPFKVDELL